MRRTRLPVWELYCYGTCLLVGIIYATYRVYDAGNHLSHVFQSSLVDGWSFLGRQKDDADDEWRRWTHFILYTLSKWLLLHYIGARIVTASKVYVLSLWYFIVTVLCVIQNFGFATILLFVLQPTIFSFILLATRSRVRIWLLSFGCCYFFTHDWVISSHLERHDPYGLIVPTLMWIYLRCISFSMYIVDNNNLSLSTSLAFFAYVFYLPSFFLGPVHLFDKFYAKMYHRTRKQALTRSAELRLIGQNLRYLFWIYFTEFSLHYLYIYSLLQVVNMFQPIGYESMWLLLGLGFHMTQFFYLKYKVVYGLMLAWTQAEGYETPNPPQCLANMHLFSDIWRLFDHGLYMFIRQHIYVPCLKFSSSKSSLMKMAIAFLCFTFVYVWHGMQYPLLMWSLLNYCGVVLEAIFRQISKTERYNRLRKIVSAQNERRLIGLVWPPFFVLFTISNFYFLAGTTITETYFSFLFFRITKLDILCLWIFTYVKGQISMEIKDYFNEHKKDEKLN